MDLTHYFYIERIDMYIKMSVFKHFKKEKKMELINEKLVKEFGLKPFQVENAIKLIDEGNTIPFIARYRKEATGEMSDEQLRDMFERLTYLRNLEKRKEEVIRLIDEQGKLTEELQAEIEKSETMTEVEDFIKKLKHFTNLLFKTKLQGS